MEMTAQSLWKAHAIACASKILLPLPLTPSKIRRSCSSVLLRRASLTALIIAPISVLSFLTNVPGFWKYGQCCPVLKASMCRNLSTTDPGISNTVFSVSGFPASSFAISGRVIAGALVLLRTMVFLMILRWPSRYCRFLSGISFFFRLCWNLLDDARCLAAIALRFLTLPPF